ncbi:MAG: sigma-70 family RNA polymerase sigma factor, partial [Sarcina sp.]
AISKYTAIDKLRKESKHYNHYNITELNLSSSQNLEDDFITNEQLNLVKVFIDKMDPTDKLIFLKKFFELENSKNIGEDLGLSEKLVNLKIFRIRKKLKSLFSEV